MALVAEMSKTFSSEIYKPLPCEILFLIEE